TSNCQNHSPNRNNMEEGDRRKKGEKTSSKSADVKTGETQYIDWKAYENSREFTAPPIPANMDTEKIFEGLEGLTTLRELTLKDLHLTKIPKEVFQLKK